MKIARKVGHRVACGSARPYAHKYDLAISDRGFGNRHLAPIRVSQTSRGVEGDFDAEHRTQLRASLCARSADVLVALAGACAATVGPAVVLRVGGGCVLVPGTSWGVQADVA